MPIKIKGARVNNLKDVDLTLPDNQLIVFTGVSGSGKTSMAVDTIYAEAQRQYLDSLSGYIQLYMQQTVKPEVDSIEGLAPSLLISQRALGKTARSTVGTVTEAYSLLRLLYSRAATPALSAQEYSFNSGAGACDQCKGLGFDLEVDPYKLVDMGRSLSEGAILHPTFKVATRAWQIMAATGLFDMEKPLKEFSKGEMHSLLHSEPVRVKDEGHVDSNVFMGLEKLFVRRIKDRRGLDISKADASYCRKIICPACNGLRISSKAQSAKYRGRSIVAYIDVPLGELLKMLKEECPSHVAGIMDMLQRIVENLVRLDLSYLSLHRPVNSLSGGEAQRVKLAKHIGYSLTEMIYVIDEPSISLHPKDHEKIMRVLRDLSDKPNTVIAIDHNESVIRTADHIVDFGPGAGLAGGQVVAQGSLEQIMAIPASSTGAYLSKRNVVPVRRERRRGSSLLRISNACLHNLKSVDVDIPTGALTCITGVSGSGKSSLLECLIEQYPEVCLIIPSPTRGNSRSILATYIGVFDSVREEFAQESGLQPGWFSFNSKGACPGCNGLGFRVMDDMFLEDVHLKCDVCQGRRFLNDVLAYKVRGMSIDEVLKLSVREALDYFENQKVIHSLEQLVNLGLGYLPLGHSFQFMSGGEAQRVKLGMNLKTGKMVYAIDEPSRGLSAEDISVLGNLLNDLVDKGNTVILVEHNFDLIKNADRVIEMGPGAGEAGGEVVDQGSPEDIVEADCGHGAFYLKQKLGCPPVV
jgi:excinuclease UvrABC ATPase subunit